jgi:DNA repair exonuclease SbcCD ATPase subunit
MAVKAVKKYYDQMCEQYHEMMENIKDLEQECQSGLVEPERIERLKEQVAPLKQNYERWAYIMFLLNEPQRKSKQPKYRKTNQKLINTLSKSNTVEATIHENEAVLKSFKEE